MDKTTATTFKHDGDSVDGCVKASGPCFLLTYIVFVVHRSRKRHRAMHATYPPNSVRAPAFCSESHRHDHTQSRQHGSGCLATGPEPSCDVEMTQRSVDNICAVFHRMLRGKFKIKNVDTRQYPLTLSPQPRLSFPHRSGCDGGIRYRLLSVRLRSNSVTLGTSACSSPR